MAIPLIWGEATAFSAPFYAKALAEERIADHFFIRGHTLFHCRERFRCEFLGQAWFHDGKCAMFIGMKQALSKAEIVRRLEKGTEAEDYFPGVLGNPVTFAARWGLPLSKGYLKFKRQELLAAKRKREQGNGTHSPPRRKAKTNRVS
jgi:hypothetical protein